MYNYLKRLYRWNTVPRVRVTFVAFLSDKDLNLSFRKSSHVTAAKEFNMEEIEL